MRYNPPPGWPPAPEGFVPEPGWQPDPSWPAPPPGWQLLVNDNQPGGTSGWAIASFVLSLLSVIPLGVVFGIIALRRIRRLGQRGRGLAIAGLVLSGVWLVASIAVLAVRASGPPSRSASSGKITHQGALGTFSMVTGDCFDNPAGARILSRVTAVPCAQPHNAQVFAKFKLPGSDFSYPGTAAVERLATSGCDSRISGIDKSKATSAMTVRVLVPQAGSWTAGQHSVSCLIVNPTSSLTASLLKP